MRLPFLLAALALSLAAPALHAQQFVACQGGVADEDDDPATPLNNFPCASVDLYAHLPHDTFGTDYGNDIWGWTDDTSGREFALVGLNNATAFVEVTDPIAPVYLGRLPSATYSSTWRDIKVYDDHAIVVSEASGHGLQVFDLTRLLDVASPPQTFSHDARFTGFGSAHNVAVDDVSGFAYAVGTDECSGGLYIVDIRDPLSPTEAGCFGSDGYTHDAQCLVYEGPDADYTGRQICVGSQGSSFGSGDHFVFVDVTDKAAPALISRAYYPSPGYAHQSWFTDDFRYVLADDELDASASGTRTLVFEVSDLDNPEFAFAHLGAAPTRDHNLYVRGGHAFQSNYDGGLRILDLSAIEAGTLSEVAYFDSEPTRQSPEGWDGQWSNYPFFPSGTVVANDQNNGLFVLRPNLTTTASEPTPGEPDGAGYSLSAPVPNPFRAGTTLRLSVARTQAVTAEAFDVAGRRVAVLHDGPVAAGGALALTLDAAALPAGLYLVRVVGEDFTATRRTSLVR